MVMPHLSKYGPMGVPKGRVVTQNLGNGSTPCLRSISGTPLKLTHRPISRMTRDWPIRTEMRLPKALRVIKKLSPRAAVVPKTAEKNRLAVTCSLAAIVAFGTVLSAAITSLFQNILAAK